MSSLIKIIGGFSVIGILSLAVWTQGSFVNHVDLVSPTAETEYAESSSVDFSQSEGKQDLIAYWGSLVGSSDGWRWGFWG